MGNFNRDRGDRGGDRRGGGGFARRDSGRGGFNRGGGGGNSMHKAVCDACKKDCEVPFRPTSGKPIFCSDCFSKQGGGDRDRGGDRGGRDRGGFGGGRDAGQSGGDSKEILKGIKTLNYKIDELIKALAGETPAKKVEKTEAAPKNKKKAAAKKVAKIKAAPKKKATPKKKVVAKKPTKKKVAKKK
jgi:CxxC-x17-CxxC domain-containing protein